MEIPHEYICTVNPNNAIDYQMVLASYEFGSFYCIYVLFGKKQNTTNTYILSFEAVTYKGNVKIGIKNVEPGREAGDSPNVHHIKIYTDISKGQNPANSKIELDLNSDNDRLLFERISPEQKDLPNYIVSEREFTRLPNTYTRGIHKTPYEIESDLAQREITDTKQDKLPKSASANYCVIGHGRVKF